ncbi:hypothetical protein G5714_016408 [Onychostoma macrolepis]|uniref:Uncharacterized protein n=1 Tax=Onychostoma macrolepis TaxID=369639 RepID=A0A7J6CA95_9TELE|nr:hypothetical protein G5714_016408 [Onychostoma macrolepis]
MFQADDDDDDEAENNEDEVIFIDLHKVLRDDSETSERRSTVASEIPLIPGGIQQKRVAGPCNYKAIKTQFSTILDSDEALLAAVTLPKFKLCWLRDETRKDTIKMTLAAQCRALTIEIPQKEPLQSPKSRDHENDFFAFPEEENQHDKQANTVDMEISLGLAVNIDKEPDALFRASPALKVSETSTISETDITSETDTTCSLWKRFHAAVKCTGAMLNAKPWHSFSKSFQSEKQCCYSTVSHFQCFYD